MRTPNTQNIGLSYHSVVLIAPHRWPTFCLLVLLPIVRATCCGIYLSFLKFLLLLQHGASQQGLLLQHGASQQGSRNVVTLISSPTDILLPSISLHFSQSGAFQCMVYHAPLLQYIIFTSAHSIGSITLITCRYFLPQWGWHHYWLTVKPSLVQRLVPSRQ